MMKTRMLIASIIMFAASVMQMAAQNDVIPIQFEDLQYTYVETPVHRPDMHRPDRVNDINKPKPGELWNESQEGFRSHVNNDVRTALSKVRRFVLMDPSVVAPKLRITGEIPLISSTTQEVIHTTKDKEGKEHTSVGYAHGANITVNLTITNLETGEMYSETFRANPQPDEKISKD